MKKFVVFLVAVGLAGYWFFMRPVCGTSGALACPDPALEQGVGVELNAKETCLGSGYLCTTRPPPFQVIRWPLDKGKLRIRVTLPDFARGDAAKEIQDAAIEGIMQWDNRPFPLVIQKSFNIRWDIGVVWTQGMFNGMAGAANPRWDFDGKRVTYSVEGIGVVVPPPGSMPPAALLKRVTDVASHEMGHALGIMWHSDRETDIMFPTLNKAPNGPSARDFQTVDALYSLPNGAMVR